MAKQGKMTPAPAAAEQGKPNKSAPRGPAPRAVAAANPELSMAPRNGGWTELANFVVTFECRNDDACAPAEQRITAHRMENDGITAKWAGDAQAALCTWMTEQVSGWGASSLSAEPAQPPVARESMGTDPSGPAAADSAKFEFATLKLLSGDQSARADMPFDVEALVEASPERDGTPDAGACTVQFFCRNASTSEATRLGMVSADRVRDTNRYRAVLRCDGLRPGTYRIESAASMPSAPDRFAYRRGPIFEVA